MKVLVIAHKPPFPTIDGGCVAVKNLLQNLIEVNSISHIDHFSLSTHKHPFKIEHFPKDWSKVRFLHEEIDTKLVPFDAIKALIRNKSYNLSRFFSKKVEHRLIELQAENQYDVVIFETPFSALYASVFNESKRILRAHNLEFEIWKNLAVNEKNPLKKWYLNQLASTLKLEEINLLNQIDCIATLSVDDEQKLKQLTNTEIVHIPVSASNHEQIKITDSPSFCFLGVMDWAPNVEAVDYFLDAILPELAKKISNPTFQIAGKYSENQLSWQNKTNVKVHGFVSDLHSFFESAGIFVAPILSGSGVKIKIMEAMSFGIPCVLTEKSAEGLLLPAAYPIAKNTKEFVELCIELYSDKTLRQSLGQLGWETMKEYYAPEKVQSSLKKLLESQISDKQLSNNP